VEREGDLTAQIGALQRRSETLTGSDVKYGRRRALRYMRHLLDYSEVLMRAEWPDCPQATSQPRIAWTMMASVTRQ